MRQYLVFVGSMWCFGNVYARENIEPMLRYDQDRGRVQIQQRIQVLEKELDALKRDVQDKNSYPVEKLQEKIKWILEQIKLEKLKLASLQGAKCESKKTVELDISQDVARAARDDSYKMQKTEEQGTTVHIFDKYELKKKIVLLVKALKLAQEDVEKMREQKCMEKAHENVKRLKNELEQAESMLKNCG